MTSRKKPKRRKKKYPALQAVPQQPLAPPTGSGPPWQPVAAPGEPLWDVAVFCERTEQTELPAELRPQAQAVRQALQEVAEGHDLVALQRLAAIPRSSPYAQWRWLLRGLIAHMAGDAQGAETNWTQLDPERRPGRIAAVLRAARGDDQTQPPGPAETTAAPMKTTERSAEAIERLRRFDSDRGAIALARQIAQSPRDDPQRRGDRSDMRFSPDDVGRLTMLRERFGEVEPPFVRQFAWACVQTCFAQPYADLFEMITSRIAGPQHDPQWHLWQAIYFSQFGDGELRSKNHLEQFADSLRRKRSSRKSGSDKSDSDESDSIRRPAIMPQVCQAILSILWARRAERVIQKRFGSPFGFGADLATAHREVVTAFKQAIQAYPTNRDAHQGLLNHLLHRLEDVSLTAAERKPLEEDVVIARRAWVDALPEEHEQRLALIDHLLDQDALEVAEQHIAVLAQWRTDNPLATALPWKLKLRQAMRLTKQKRYLDQAAEALDEAQQLWPAWLSKDWLAFLWAAMVLRAGDEPHAHELLDEIRARPQMPAVTFDVLWFGAAQQMNLPPAVLRPLRAAVDAHARAAAKLPLGDLIHLGAAFWDLQRSGIMYRGYRTHGSKFGKALSAALKSPAAARDEPAFFAACFWAASHRYWRTADAVKPPHAITALARRNPLGDAVILTDLVAQNRFYTMVKSYLPLIGRVRDLAQANSDPFYRHYLGALVQQAEQAQQKAARRRAFSPWFDDDDFDDDDDDDEFLCDCPACRAERGEIPPELVAEELGDDDDEPPEFPWRQVIATAPPEIRKLLERLPADRQKAFCESFLAMLQGDLPSPEVLLDILRDAGFDPANPPVADDWADEDWAGDDDDQFEDDDQFDDVLDPSRGTIFPPPHPRAAPSQPPLTAEQKRELRKKRKRLGKGKRR